MQKMFEIYIKTTPERLWEAITDSELRRRYNFGVGVETDWAPGSRYEGLHPGAPHPIVAGENLEVDPPRRLVQSFEALWGRTFAAKPPPASPGRSSPSPTPAARSSPTTISPMTPTKKSMAAGR